MSVVTRFAPSPTGLLHVGNLRTALLNWVLARRSGGRFLLRLDDTDEERSRPEFADAIRRDLDWLRLEWDEELRQSDRLDLYEAAAERLREAGRLYACFETAGELELRRRAARANGRPPVYDRAALRLSQEECERLAAERPAHWRFLLKRERIAWDDLVAGPQEVDAGSVSDPVLIRGDGRFLYTLCSVTDDGETGVTHVVRGADHVTNTGVQIQIFAALGAAAPAFGHHSLMTGPGGEPLSKREGGAALRDLREAGVEPEALLGLVWALGRGEAPRPLSAAELAAGAEEGLGRHGQAPVRFDPAALAPLTAQKLRETPYEAVAERMARAGVAGPEAEALWLAVRENVGRVEEAADWWRICRDGVERRVAPEDEEFVAEALALLPPPPWDGTTWREWTSLVKQRSGRKGRGLFLPLRRALTGRDSGPEMAALLPLLSAAQRNPAR